MFCPNCGVELEPGSRFCHSCGNQVEGNDTGNDGLGEETAFLPPRQQNEPNQDTEPFSANATVPVQGTLVQQAQPAGGGGAVARRAGVSRTTIIAAAIAVVAVIAIALAVFLALRPQSGAEPRFTIQYETDGGTAIAAMQVEEGEKVTSPANPTKDGYEFDGWYADPARTQKVAFPFAADENTVLYAKWTEKKGADSSSGSAADAGNQQNTAPIVIYNNTTPSPNNYVPTRPSSGYILPNSASTYLSASDVSYLSNDDLSRAMNEIWARHGRRFKNNWLQSYFNSMTWYRGTIDPDSFNSVYTPTDIENKNAELMSSILSERGYDVNRAHPN